MKINSIINGYTLKKSIHMCNKRTLWSAKSNQTGENYVLSFYKTIGSVKAAQKKQKYQQMQQQLKHAVIPVHIFDYSSSNTSYRVEAMHEIDGINMHHILFQDRSHTSEIKEINKAIKYCDQLIEGLQQLQRMSYRHESLKLKSLMVKNQNVYVIGTWTPSPLKPSKKKTELEKAKEYQTKKIAYASSVKNVLLQILLKRAQPLILGKPTEADIQRYTSLQFITSGDSDLISLIKRILQANPMSQNMLEYMKRELNSTFEVIKSKRPSFRFLLPLKSIEEDQDMIETNQWLSRVCRTVNHKKLNLKFGKEDGVQYLYLKYQKLKVIYTYDWIPQDIKVKFSSISQIFEFLEKQEISIEGECIVLQNMFQIISKSTVSKEDKPIKINPQIKTTTRESKEAQIQEKIKKTTSKNKIVQHKQVAEMKQRSKLLQRQKSSKKKPPKFKVLDQFPVLKKDGSVEECQLLAEKIQMLKEIKDFDKSSYYTNERYQNMGVEYFKVDKFNEAMDYFIAALYSSRRLITQQNKLIIEENPSLYNNLALIFAKCNRPQQAIYYSRQSINMINQRNIDPKIKAETYNLFASILLHYYNETALSRDNILAAFNCEIEKEECATSRRLLNTMGILLMKEQKYERACEFFINAVKTENSPSDAAPDESQFAFIFINLATAYSFLLNDKNSLKYVKQALNICCSHEALVRKEAVKILLRLTQSYAKQKKINILQSIKEVLLQYSLDREEYCPRVLLKLFKLE